MHQSFFRNRDLNWFCCLLYCCSGCPCVVWGEYLSLPEEVAVQAWSFNFVGVRPDDFNHLSPMWYWNGSPIYSLQFLKVIVGRCHSVCNQVSFESIPGLIGNIHCDLLRFQNRINYEIRSANQLFSFSTGCHALGNPTWSLTRGALTSPVLTGRNADQGALGSKVPGRCVVSSCWDMESLRFIRSHLYVEHFRSWRQEWLPFRHMYFLDAYNWSLI